MKPQYLIEATVDLGDGSDDNDYIVNPYLRLNDSKQLIYNGAVGGRDFIPAGGEATPYTTEFIIDKPTAENIIWYLGYENYRDLSHQRESNKGSEESDAFQQGQEPSPLEIQNVTVVNTTKTTALISWETNINADAQVEYGLDSGYGSLSTLKPEFEKLHLIELTDLQESTIYFFRVLAHDEESNLTVADDFQFTTDDAATSNLSARVEIDITTPSQNFTCRVFNNSQIENITSIKIALTSNKGAFDVFRRGHFFSVSPNVRSNNDDIFTQEVKLAFSGSGLLPGASDQTRRNSDLDRLIEGFNVEVTFSDGSLLTQQAVNIGDSDDDNPALWVAEVSHGEIDDTVPSILTNILALEISAKSSMITWNSDTQTATQIQYGLDSNYDQNSQFDEGFVTDHRIELMDLIPNTTYHFQILSRDTTGHITASDDITFTTKSEDSTETLTIVDNFNRSNLGNNWNIQSEYWQMTNNEFGLTEAATQSWQYLAIFNNVNNGNDNKIVSVSHRWGKNTSTLGRRKGAIAIMVNEDSTGADGYWIWHSLGKVRLGTIVNGEPGDGLEVVDWPGLADPVAGDVITVVIRQEADGNYFDYYINDQLSATAVDPAKLFPESDTWYTGLFLRGEGVKNEIDDFTVNYHQTEEVMIAANIPLSKTGHLDINPMDESNEVEAFNLPIDFSLSSFPNPSNFSKLGGSGMTIRYDLSNHANVILDVVDLIGRVVNTLIDGNRNSGSHHVLWYGKNNRGRRVAHGVYFMRLRFKTSANPAWQQIVHRVMMLP